MARKREIEAVTKKRIRKLVHPTGFNSQMENYLSFCIEKNLTDKTRESYIFYLNLLKTYLVSKRHSLLVDEITEEDMKGFFQHLRDKGNTQSSINSKIETLRPFFTYLVSNGIIAESPMKRIVKGKVDKKTIIPFNENDMNLLIKQPDKSTPAGYRDYCIMLMLYSTGMRIGECLNLKISDVSFKEERIIITETKNRQPRIVGLAKRLKPELKKYMELCLPDDRNSAHDYLFQNQDGGQLKDRTIQDRIQKYGKQAGIKEKRVSPHTFRHTFAISYLKNGGSTASLREQLGHLTITVVEKYLYWATEDKIGEHKKYNPLDNMAIVQSFI